MSTKINLIFRNAALASLAYGSATLNIYTGTQPATADTAPSGTLLVSFTNLAMGAVAAGAVALDATQGPYQAAAQLAGTAGWGRLSFADGSVIDGNVATSGAQFNISSTVLAVNDVVILNTCTITMPGV